MDGAEDGGVHGAICNQIIKECVVDLTGVIHIGKFCLLREGVGAQPVRKEKIHAETSLRILRRMYVQIRKSGNNDTVPEVRYRQGCELLGQGAINAVDDSVFHSYITVLVNSDFIPALRIKYISAVDFHMIVSCNTLMGVLYYEDRHPNTAGIRICSCQPVLTRIPHQVSSARLGFLVRVAVCLFFVSPATNSVQERDDLAARTRHAVSEGAVRESFRDAKRAAPQDGCAVGGGQLVFERADI